MKRILCLKGVQFPLYMIVLTEFVYVLPLIGMRELFQFDNDLQVQFPSIVLVIKSL